MSNISPIFLPLGILLAALLLFISGFLWARWRDRHESLNRVREQQVEEVLAVIEGWAGSRKAAYAWYQSYPIPPLGGRTAEQLVDEGRIDDLLAYLEHVNQGGYA